jgi:CHAT domain-containing protein
VIRSSLLFALMIATVPRPARACSDPGRLAADFVARLESQDPRTVSSGAAQSMRESAWESARQVWTTYDVIDVDSYDVVRCQRRSDGLMLHLRIRAKAHIPGTTLFVPLPEEWALRYRNTRLIAADYGQAQWIDALYRGRMPDADALPATPLTVSLLTTYVSTRPPPPNIGQVAELAATVARRAGDPFSIAVAMQAKVTVLRLRGNSEEAFAAAEAAAAAARQLNAPDAIAQSGLLLGRLLIECDMQAAREMHRQVAALQPVMRDQTIALMGALRADARLEETSPKSFLRHARAIRAAALDLGWHEGAAMAAHSIGDVYGQSGYRDLALREYAIADRELAAAGLSYWRTLVLLDKGAGEYVLGRTSAAIRSERKALALSANDLTYRPAILSVLADVLMKERRYREARAVLEEAMDIGKKSGNREALMWAADTMSVLANTTHDYPSALHFARQHLQLAGADAHWTFLAKTEIGRALHGLHRNAEAKRELDECVALIESIRRHFPVDADAESTYFEEAHRPYYELASIAVEEGRLTDAVHIAERLKGRTLQDAFEPDDADVLRSMSPEERRRERELNGEIASLNRQLLTSADPAQVLRSLRPARRKMDAFRADLFVLHPNLRKRRTGEAEPLDLRKLFAAEGRAVLDYIVTDDETLVLVLTSTATGVRIRAHRIAVGTRDLTKLVNTLRSRISKHDLAYAEQARKLAALLLQPASSDIRDAHSLVVAPDGVLWNVPFAVLPLSGTEPLIQDFVVSYVPSLAMLESPPRAAPPEMSLLALGAPNLGPPLRDAEREVESIAKLYGERNCRVYTGKAAQEEIAKREGGRFRILHFATHALVDDQQPMYSSLLLARDEADDGFLEAREIADMHLHADLAIMSACETARGAIHPGDGVIGLSWAFMVAGCPRTVVSQWPTKSAPTAQLMIEFHRRLVAGQKPAAALRAAECALRKEPRYSHPFYWAAFVLVGSVDPP